MINRRKYGGQECHILVSMEKRVLCIPDNIRAGMKNTDVKESSFHFSLHMVVIPFLSDPGVPGVRSMGLGLCHSNTMCRLN